MKVGIIGIGVVGSAMLEAFRERGVSVIAYDKYRLGFDDNDVHFEALLECGIVFVSVPTPTKESGDQDTSALEEVLSRLTALKYSGIVVNRCTVLPGTGKSLSGHFDSLKIIHYPEFLREQTAYEDFKYQSVALLSGPRVDAVLEVAEFLRDVFPKITIKIFLKYASTEIAKYTHNCFLAVKLSFLNEIYDVCDIFDVSYKEMITAVIALGKIGENHTEVPGKDGKRGFGGMCFPKDTKAFFHRLKASVPSLETLKGAIESNLKIRGVK